MAPTATGSPVETLEILGPDRVVLPGSDQFMFAFGVLWTAVAAVALGIVWWRRRRRARSMLPARRPTTLVVAVSCLVVGAVMTVVNRPPPFWVPEFPPLPQLLPDEAFYYQRADGLPVAEGSDEMVAASGSRPLVAGMSSRAEEVTLGRPFNLVDDTTTFRDIHTTTVHPEYDGPIPITDPAYVEWMPGYGHDNHYIALDLEGRRMWELISFRRWFWRWEAGRAALWDLDELRYPPWATTASGLPMLPGAVTWEEVDSGSVDHVIMFSSPVTSPTDSVWPARQTDGTSTAPSAPPMGSWFRLRADADLGELGPQSLVIAEALRTHGMVLSDTGGAFALYGVPDGRWDREDLLSLRNLTSDDFEVVDASSLVVDEDSMEARPTRAPADPRAGD